MSVPRKLALLAACMFLSAAVECDHRGFMRQHPKILATPSITNCKAMPSTPALPLLHTGTGDAMQWNSMDDQYTVEFIHSPFTSSYYVVPAGSKSDIAVLSQTAISTCSAVGVTCDFYYTLWHEVGDKSEQCSNLLGPIQFIMHVKG